MTGTILKDGATLIKLSELREVAVFAVSAKTENEKRKKAFSRAADGLESASNVATFGDTVWLVEGQR